MLIRDNVVFIFGVDRLVLRWDVDFLRCQLGVGAREVFEKAAVQRGVEMQVVVG